jgi:hypothetical protein
MIQKINHCHQSNLYSHQAILFQIRFDLMAISVNTADNDGGLRSCLDSARLDPLIIRHIEEAGAQSLSDFVNSVTVKDYASELKTVYLDLVKVEEEYPFQTQPIQLARLRAAWSAGKKALKMQQGGESKPKDVEDPLGKALTRDLAAQWTRSYPFITFDEFLTGTDTLIARCYREFRENHPTVLAISKVKALAWDRMARETRKERLANDITTKRDAQRNVSVDTVFEYYWGLRILAHVWAYVGNYKVQSTAQAGTQVLFIALSQSMRYADNALRLAMQTGNAQSSTWLRKHDVYTRRRTVILARRGIPFGEALDQAWAEAEVEWTFKNSTINGSPPARSKSHSQIWLTICSDYNHGRCVDDAGNCPMKKEHVCDFVDKATNKVCGLCHSRRRHI